MKKIISVLLAILMLVSSLCVLSAFAEDTACDCVHMPLIYVFGKQTIYDDPASDNRVQLDGIDTNWAKGMVSDGSKLLTKAVISGKYDEFYDYVVGNFEERYGEFACQKNGDLPDNTTGIDWSWSPETINGRDHDYDNVYSYVYIFDAREDPMLIADDLHDYVEAVRAATGHRRVAILSRCMGTEMCMAYFEKYGWEDIDTFFAYSSAAWGTTIFSEIFAGKIEFDVDALSQYYSEKHENDEGNQLILTMLELATQLRALGLTEKAANRLMNKMKDELLPRILKCSFATSPGYWSMVGPNDYEDAKAFLFKNDADEYSELIERIDSYDRQVRRPMTETLKEMNSDVNVMILAKYGFQMIPLTASQHEQSDDKISTFDQSFGATCSKYGETFSKSYLEKAKAEGRDKYISPDNIIDASTCPLPDQTWFVKNIRHNDFPGQFYDLVIRQTRADRQITVDDDPAWPQYTTFYWQNGQDYWVPMTDENMNTEYKQAGFFATLIAFFKAFFAYIGNLFRSAF